MQATPHFSLSPASRVALLIEDALSTLARFANARRERFARRAMAALLPI